MSQNRSTAVMQRRKEPHDSLEDFPTPPWATRALCRALFRNAMSNHLSVREPAANRGHMVRPLAEYFGHIEAADIFDYGAGFSQLDYLFGPLPAAVDWTITDPPFRLAEQFIERALATSLLGVAVLVRSAFLEGVGRHQRLFSVRPPSRVLQFSERVVIHKGRLSPDGSTATAYCWVIWETERRDGPTRFEWIEPCRSRLERPGDYPDAAPPDTGNEVWGNETSKFEVEHG